MENTRDEESSMKASKMNKSFQMIPWESDDIPDEQEMDYKELSYKLFQYRAYKLRSSNGEFRCPFCANYDKEEDDCHCTRLLLHAIQVAETSDSCKERANHFAMARYLAFYLADQVIAEAQQPHSAQYRKRPRLDEDSSGGVVQMEEALVKLETELKETKDQMNDLIRIKLLNNDALQGARRELVEMEEALVKLQTELNETKEIQIERLSNDDELQGARRELVKEKALKTLLKENEELKWSITEVVKKKRQSRDQLRRVRKAVTKGLSAWQRGNNGCIGIKKMGEIDVIAFKKSCMRMKGFLNLPPREAENRAVQLCFVWQEKLKCSDWHPFRIIGDDKGNLERQLNEDDESLEALKEECGEEAFNAVVMAFKNMMRYRNRRRIDIVPVMWNFDENREAELEEVIGFVFQELMALRN